MSERRTRKPNPAVLLLRRQQAAEDYELQATTEKGKKARSLNGTNCAKFLVKRHNLCVIDDEPHFLKTDKDEPGCDNIYVSGRAWLGKVLKLYVPNLPRRAYDDVMQDVEDELADAEDRGLIFRSSRNIFCDAKGTIIRINTMPGPGQGIVEVVGRLSADDHITSARRLGCVYDASATEHEFVERWLLEVAQGDPWLAWLVVQTCLSSCLCPSAEYKGIACLYGPHGSDSKGVLSRVRYAMFSPSAFFKGKLHKLAGFQGAMLLGKIGFVDDDLSDGALSNDVCSTLKGWTGGDPIDVEPKYGTAPVTVSDPTMIVLTNHPLQLAQTEHATNAWERRLTVVPFYQEYKENPDAAKGELPIIKEFHRLITEDPRAMSFLLNLALKGVEMMVRQDGYVKTRESERLKREWLGLGNSVSDFFGEVDVFGSGWTCPHLVRFGPLGRERALIYPAWMTESASRHLSDLRDVGGRSSYYYDESLARRGAHLCFHPDQILMSQDIAAVLGRYAAWHHDNGGGDKGRLQRNSFSRLLKAEGYRTSQVRAPLTGSRKFTAVYPAGIEHRDWLTRELTEHNERALADISETPCEIPLLPYPRFAEVVEEYAGAIQRNWGLFQGVSAHRPPDALLQGGATLAEVRSLDGPCRDQLALIGLMAVANRRHVWQVVPASEELA